MVQCSISNPLYRFSVVTVRDAKHTNFVEFRNFKIVYRRYAGLYFCICVDVADNNLFYLEAIHNFVEVLNEYFHNVCELDLVFNFYRVYTVVDEMFLAGEMRETSQTKGADSNIHGQSIACDKDELKGSYIVFHGST